MLIAAPARLPSLALTGLSPKTSCGRVERYASAYCPGTQEQWQSAYDDYLAYPADRGLIFSA